MKTGQFLRLPGDLGKFICKFYKGTMDFHYKEHVATWSNRSINLMLLI